MGGLNHKGSYSGMLARTEQRADCVGQARRNLGNLGTTGDLNKVEDCGRPDGAGQARQYLGTEGLNHKRSHSGIAAKQIERARHAET